MFVAIDTSGKKGALSIENNGEIIYSVDFYNFNSHSSYLTQILENALKTIRKEIKDITAVGAVDGPGSFTGLRISFSYLQGLTIGKDTLRYKMPAIFVPVYFIKQNFEDLYDGFYNVIKIKTGFNVIAKFYFNDIKKPIVSVYEDDFEFNKAENFIYISNSDEVKLDIKFVDYYNFNLNSASEFIKSLRLLDFENVKTGELFSPEYFKKSEAEIAKKG